MLFFCFCSVIFSLFFDIFRYFLTFFCYFSVISLIFFCYVFVIFLFLQRFFSDFSAFFQRFFSAKKTCFFFAFFLGVSACFFCFFLCSCLLWPQIGGAQETFKYIFGFEGDTARGIIPVRDGVIRGGPPTCKQRSRVMFATRLRASKPWLEAAIDRAATVKQTSESDNRVRGAIGASR